MIIILNFSFLLQSGDLKIRRAKYIFDNLSVHLLDLGVTGRGESKNLSNCLLTFHKFDKESDCHVTNQSWDNSQFSRSGIIGRIIWGVFQKIYIGVKLQGVIPVHGELLDSSAYLAITLINLVHNFNMDTLEDLEIWMSKLEVQMNQIAVSKHNFHIDEVKRMCIDSENYIKPFHDLLLDMVATENDTTRKKKKLRTGQVELIINREVLFPFLGNIGSVALLDLLEGNNQSELKGSKYWLTKLEKRVTHSDQLLDRYNEILDEKRNFWGFLFTLVSLVLWPIGTLLGYHGMNFDNMEEHALSYKPVGGIKLFWLQTCVIYGIMFLWALDKKIIYMGT